MSTACNILYCHCAYARVVPPQVKAAVLDALSRSSASFQAVPDLCEMSARRDPRLRELASEPGLTPGLTIIACYPRAVRWLFAAADAPLPESGATVLNMRTDTAEVIVERLLGAAPVTPQEARQDGAS